MASDKNRRIVANYDEVARVSPLDILLTGRYSSSAFGYAGRLGRFLAYEMELHPTDRVLDAGCSVGVYHSELASRANLLVGVDASPRSIDRARARHKSLPNVEYRVVELTDLQASDFPQRFDKILCYSVVHFLGDMAELESLMKAFIGLLEGGHGMIFLGEVREREMYEHFQRGQNKSYLRNVKFSLLKKIQKWLLRGGRFTEGTAPTLFGRREIEDLVARLGGKCERIEQASWHPFYNTCADYRLRF